MGKKSWNSLKRLKYKLFSINPSCHWCKQPVKMYGTLLPGESLPPDSATIDHVKSKPERGFSGHTEKVLACHACNHRRNEEEKRQRPELHELHGRRLRAKNTLEKMVAITGRLVDLPLLLDAIEPNENLPKLLP